MDSGKESKREETTREETIVGQAGSESKQAQLSIIVSRGLGRRNIRRGREEVTLVKGEEGKEGPEKFTGTHAPSGY
jgi:hypothetical protein